MRLTNDETMTNYKKSNNIPLDYELYSPQVWYKKGFKVKKGSVCKHRVFMCADMHKARKSYMKEYSLFSRDQVEKRV